MGLRVHVPMRFAQHYGRMRSDLGSCALQQVQGLGLGFAVGSCNLPREARQIARAKLQTQTLNPEPCCRTAAEIRLLNNNTRISFMTQQECFVSVLLQLRSHFESVS